MGWGLGLGSMFRGCATCSAYMQCITLDSQSWVHTRLVQPQLAKLHAQEPALLCTPATVQQHCTKPAHLSVCRRLASVMKASDASPASMFTSFTATTSPLYSALYTLPLRSKG